MTKKEIFLNLVKAYYKTRRNIRSSKDQLEFEMDLEHNLYSLCLELFHRNYSFSRALLFIAKERVARQVCAPHIRDRVVSVLLSTFLLLIFEPCFIADSFACRVGKGVLFGVKRRRHELRQASRNFHVPVLVIKLDIEGFFLNINHVILDDIITKKLTSRKTIKKWGKTLSLDFILWLSRVFIYRDLLKNCLDLTSSKEERRIPANKLLKNHPDNCGLIPGDCSGQLFANIYADRQDQHVKRQLHCRHYGRYMDDAEIYLNASSEHAEEILQSISDFDSSNLAVHLHEKKSKISTYTNQGTPFLGARLLFFRISPCSYIYKTIRRALKGFRSCTASIRASLNSYCSYLSHYTYNRYKIASV